MKQYDSYKPSGVEWIGDIPSHWEISRIKFLGETLNGLTYKPINLTGADAGVLVLRASNIQNAKLTFEDNVFVDMQIPPELRVRNNDIVICSTNGSLSLVGKLAIVDFDLHATFGSFMLLFRNSPNQRFSLHMLNVVIPNYKALFGTTTINQLTKTTFGNMICPLPPLEEQEQIAKYLDVRCAEIDGLIEKEEKTITLLDELKQSIITEAVTRGLDPTAPLKPSGVEWIGDIPSHWEYIRIKYMLSRSSAGVWGADALNNENDIICYRVADFDYNQGVLKSDNITLRNIEKKQLDGRLVSQGDLLIEKSGGGEVSPVGRVVRVNFADKATCSNFIHSITVKTGYDSIFLYYYFHQLYSKRINLLFFNQTTGIQNLQIDKYLSQGLFLPPLEEQEQIAEYLDKRCGEIEAAKAKKLRQIELLRELKQTLISDAVTGRIKVI